MNSTMKIFSGSASTALTAEIADSLGTKVAQADVRRFSDGETWVELDENVRGCDVFVVQSTSNPANHNLMELLVMIDALKRASAKRINAVLPYYGYARQDRKVAPRTPISAKLVADLIVTAGAHRVLSMDLHAGQIQGFFNIPFDHLFSAPVMVEHIQKSVQGDIVIVSPDAGGVERARAYAKHLDASLAIIDKRREKANVSEVMHVIGDVKDKVAVIVDDMIDTAGTVTQAVPVLKEFGAQSVHCAATHAVLSGPAIERINMSDLEQVAVTNTIALASNAQACERVKVCSVASLLGEAIKRIHEDSSVSSLFIG
ncbi:MAG: ribose-phosphate pyrophosphokinase [Deltaproteobacteria bacterium]|nr:ribose-phosphate pyrophosphokinase [Deltaproteobacteria bacterium]